MKRLIENNISITEQFRQMKEFEEMCDNLWYKRCTRRNKHDMEAKRKCVEEEFGIKTFVSGKRLIEPRIVDESKCLFYLIRK